MDARILGSLFVIGVVSAFVGYGTYAYFSDTETSTGNLFTAGTLDLLLNNANGVVATVSANNMAPGDSVSGSIVLRSAGTVATGLDLDLKATDVVTDAGANASDPDDGDVSPRAMDSYLMLTTLTYGGANLLTSVPDVNLDGKISIAELAARGPIVDLASPGNAGTTLALTIQLDASTPNHIKHDATTMTLSFLLAQSGAADLS